jgi:hypothetical protein
MRGVQFRTVPIRVRGDDVLRRIRDAVLDEEADDIVKIEARTIIVALYHPDDRAGLATRVTRKRGSPAVTPMTRTGANLNRTAIPFVWRLRMLLHGVRLSRLAYDDVTADCDEEPRTYRAAMTDEDLVGIDSAPLAVRVNLRAASFVLRAFAQQTAELRADHSGALIAIHCAPDGACHPIAIARDAGQRTGGDQRRP